MSIPLHDETYFRSPLSTLLHSLDGTSSRITIIDLCDAYQTLLSRFQLHSRLLDASVSEPGIPFASLECLRRHTPALTRCLSRDIGGEFVQSGGGFKTRKLGHLALWVLAAIFRLDALHNLFSARDLTKLLGNLLELQRDGACSVQHTKTHSILIWILRTQDLPATILSPHISGIMRCISGTLAPRGVTSDARITTDGLGALRSLLSRHGHLCLPHTVPLLAAVCYHLTAPESDVKTAAADALCGYVIALRNQGHNQKVQKEISEMIGSYVETETSRQYRDKPNSLPTILRTATEVNTTSKPVDPPPPASWAFVVLACIVLLSDFAFFMRPRTLKLVLPALARVRKPWPKLHAAVWKCLVEVLARLYRREPCLVTQSAAKEGGLKAMTEPALNVVKQEVAHGIGAALVSKLLEMHDIHHGLDCALSVTQQMVGSDRWSIHQDGFRIYMRMLTPGTTHSTPPGPLVHEQPTEDQKLVSIIPTILTDGTLLEAVDSTSLADLSAELPPQDDVHIRTLSDEEIVRHWDELVAIFKRVLHRHVSVHSIPEQENIRRHLIAAWQTLLLAQTQLSQGRGHLAPPPDFIERSAALVARIYETSGSDTEQGRSPLSLALTTVARDMWPWTVSDEAWDAWDGLWNRIMSRPTLDSASVAEIVIERSTSPHLMSLSTFIMRVLGHWIGLNAPDCAVLHCIGHLLRKLYPMDRAAVPAALEGWQVLRTMFQRWSPEQLIATLRAMNDGLGMWLRDESLVFTDDEYNEHIIPLYANTLDQLRRLPAHQNNLDAIAPFLGSVFHRNPLPVPLFGPDAFGTYWQETYAGIVNIHVPPELKDCVHAYVEAFGGDVTISESQLSSSSPSTDTVPDSQATSITRVLPSLVEPPSSQMNSRLTAARHDLFPPPPPGRRPHHPSPLSRTLRSVDPDQQSAAIASVPTPSATPRSPLVPRKRSSPERSPCEDRRRGSKRGRSAANDLGSPIVLKQTAKAQVPATPARSPLASRPMQPSQEPEDYGSWEIHIPSPEVRRMASDVASGKYMPLRCRNTPSITRRPAMDNMTHNSSEYRQFNIPE
ncbi:hypothetical protein PUNSTDRAFT_131239 [Punctularia strigosozonata HHB-11173 SS5]|uniref:uncharacterized protein n=1 Tax=Punctularia strigosozonata (strain HHB-11173) TaxID=741275 RepID=UPI000441719A|nr:uncharacterized protein PUNSTDRAFT_131239 [Punctularia strigosozonata HHB-11173 SS5]EIN13013.1 hypothetical protein PUNSTDRAFT_131239 [Punctularia strigosozonata HHB-11173 SS5]